MCTPTAFGTSPKFDTKIFTYICTPYVVFGGGWEGVGGGGQSAFAILLL